MPLRHYLALATVVLAFASVSSMAIAQQATTNDGVYTQAQVDAGRETFTEYCAACHETKFYQDIWPAWEGRSLKNFWFIIVGEMPADNPGMLYNEEYTNIVSTILADLGFPAGDTPLDPNGNMEDILIAAP